MTARLGEADEEHRKSTDRCLSEAPILVLNSIISESEDYFLILFRASLKDALQTLACRIIDAITIIVLILDHTQVVQQYSDKFLSDFSYNVIPVSLFTRLVVPELVCQRFPKLNCQYATSFLFIVHHDGFEDHH